MKCLQATLKTLKQFSQEKKLSPVHVETEGVEVEPLKNTELELALL